MIRPAPTADSPVTLLRPWHPQLAGCASPLFGGIMTHPQLPPASGPGSSLAFQSLRVQAHLRIGNDSCVLDVSGRCGVDHRMAGIHLKRGGDGGLPFQPLP